SKNTVCRAAHRVVLAVTKLLDALVVFPGHLSVLKIKKAFYAITGIPRAIGAINCTHIPIRTPLGEHEEDYVNRKSFHSNNVQGFDHIMACDYYLMVTSLEARWPGSVHDSHIFQETTLGQKFEQGCCDGLPLGDRGYPCLHYLMTPYTESF
ncbi:HARB1 nuclease, partial [Amia calva]|nr:HARB1 nuclease [Amia calva]